MAVHIMKNGIPVFLDAPSEKTPGPEVPCVMCRKREGEVRDQITKKFYCKRCAKEWSVGPLKIKDRTYVLR